MIRISAFRSVPPFAQGAVRDFRVRWALEEAGLPYEVRLLGQGDQKSDSYRELQPFGQVPSFEDGELTLFESGRDRAAHRGEVRRADAEGRRRAAHARGPGSSRRSTPSSHISRSSQGSISSGPGRRGRRSGVRWSRRWCASGSASSPTRWTGRDYLEDRFTAGDLMMSAVLRILRHTKILDDFPSLAAYRARCEARPAFKRAIDAQMRQFDKAA